MSDFYTLTDEEQADRLAGLATAALAYWQGAYLTPRLIKYRENAVFAVDRTDGSKVALRIHRHGYHSDAALRSELHWMQALEKAGIDVPPIIPATDGRLFVHAGVPGIPEIRQIDMLGWVTGAPVGSAEAGLALDEQTSVRLFHDAGMLAARLHNETTAMRFPDDFTRHSWCDLGLVGDDPLWGRFWELATLTDDERVLLLAARAAARDDLSTLDRSSASFGLIHADFVPENLLSENGRLKLIDFDDSGYGWHVFELATALYFNLDEPHFPALRQALIEGYRKGRSFSSEDEARLPLFLFLRGTTYLGWLQTRPETQTARELGPLLVGRTCALARQYLAAR